MTAKTFEIQVQDDHLQRISQVRKPILAIAELIWNAVDADADRIDVVLHDDNLGGLKAIEVVDSLIAWIKNSASPVSGKKSGGHAFGTAATRQVQR